MGIGQFFMTGGLSLAAFLTAYFLGKDHRQPGDAAAVRFLWLLAAPAAIRLALPLLQSPGKLAFAKDIIPLAFSPALYLYASSLLSKKNRTGPRSYMHFLPLAIAAAILFSPLVSPGPDGDKRFDGGGSALERSREPGPGFLAAEQALVKPPFINAVQLLVPAAFVVYAVPIFGILRKHRERSKDYFSFASSAINLSWLGVLVAAFAAVFGYMLIALLLALSGVRHILINPVVSMDIGYGSFIAIFGYFALRQERAFYRYGYLDGQKDAFSLQALAGDQEPNSRVPDTAVESDSEEPKYSKSSLDGESMDRYFAKLERMMSGSFLYRKSDLTMDDLAKLTGISRHYISQTINRKTGRNFYGYVNSLRVAEVISALDDASRSGKTILELAFDAGFNSKSSFIAYFKESTGVTPSSYRSRRLLGSPSP
jgi:AraC-like DNA-binding protein